MNALVRRIEPASGIRQVPLAAIKKDALAQPRAVIDMDLVAEYREAMTAGEQFPPLVVFNDRRTYWLADGFHRHRAAVEAGLREIACVVKDGGLREAILYSCQANAAHGWRRTNEDKRRAALTLLADEEWGAWSDREIARHAKLSNAFVSKLRAEDDPTVNVNSESDGRPVRNSSERTFVTKHGTRTTMDTSRIGKAMRSDSRGGARGEELARTFIERFGADDLQVIAGMCAEIVGSQPIREAFLAGVNRRLRAPGGWDIEDV